MIVRAANILRTGASDTVEQPTVARQLFHTVNTAVTLDLTMCMPSASTAMISTGPIVDIHGAPFCAFPYAFDLHGKIVLQR